ncbi:1-acyl-sn-glycerol-3-phosphate acyltransferase [Variovorax sp. NFACC27]|uniref:1-acyl-sn-glycerol-3-phosphate acyltransferase n=1 Tax=unclassified Variovorax TaxID=663243 RepID=UPI000896860A|nr:1-acyl-sn-glycerol-3-phosphate acyltransferase [Variovorax sp. YR750]SEF20429.1 Acyltransferase [Variovorax sp. NFACC28]SEF58710.1 Acyltransferase [Variovorax sp. NFACC29]SFB71705.1 Acyltransferase [Variovorax sp. NFACC26]SFG57473.1 Acyltransferase [Variovorax sp. NFACC27]SEK90291.1 Acyltransferase [Variovorax sp. YR750]
MLAKLTGWLLLGIVRLLTGAQARWYGCPPKAEQRIYFANHQSHADLVMIWAALPEELRSITRPIAARDYWANTPVKRWITTEVFNAVYVERQATPAAASAAATAPTAPVVAEAPPPPPVVRAPVPSPAERIEPSMEPLLPLTPPEPPLETVASGAQGRLDLPEPPAPPPAPPPEPPPPSPPAEPEAPSVAATPAVDPLAPLVEALRSGDSIIIFPEGTRGHTGEPQKFKSGLYTLATMFPEVVLVPAWIDNVQRVMPKGEIVPVPILCSVTFGAPIRVEEGEERRPFLDRARAAVIALRDV